MRKLFKCLWAVTACAMLVSAMAGCGGQSSDGPNDSSAPTTASPSASSENFLKEGLPIVNEPVTLDVLTTRWGSMGGSFAQNQFLIDLETQTNVKIEWQVQSLNDWNEQKSILLASGTLPGIIFGSQTFSDQDIINNLDYFLPLDELIDQYMPNYKAALEETPSLKQIATFPDGKMYSMAKNLPARPKTRNQPIINKAWLDRLALNVPTTLEELYDVLKAFKEKDANGNGDPNDEIPYTSRDFHVDMLNPFGITDINDTSMMIKDGKLIYYPTSEEYKEGLKWLRKLYAEGIIDQEMFTQDETMLTAKFQDPNISRVGLTFQWTPDAVFNTWKDEYIAIAPIAGPDGKRYAGGDADGVFSVSRNEVEITRFCEYPEVAARWVDQFYTGEASIQNFWGAVGTVIQKNSDGTYELLNPPEGTSADAWYWDQSLRDFGPKYISPDFAAKIRLSPASGDGLKVEISKLGDPYVTTPFPNVMYTIEEFEELPTLSTDINTYVATTRATWITGGGIDEEWDAYVRQLNNMGLERLIQIRSEAYDRFVNVK